MLIWKYPVPITPDLQSIPMPRGAQVLSCQFQAGSPCLWAAVDPEAPSETKHFRWLMTDDHRPEAYDSILRGRFIASLQSPLVFHLFEVPE